MVSVSASCPSTIFPASISRTVTCACASVPSVTAPTKNRLSVASCAKHARIALNVASTGPSPVSRAPRAAPSISSSNSALARDFDPLRTSSDTNRMRSRPHGTVACENRPETMTQSANNAGEAVGQARARRSQPHQPPREIHRVERPQVARLLTHANRMDGQRELLRQRHHDAAPRAAIELGDR